MTLDLGLDGPRVVGFDLSLTSTGIGVIDRHQGWAHRLTTGKLRGHPRAEYIVEQCVRWAVDADLVLIEGPAYGKNQGAFVLGGIWWLVTHHFWRAGIRYVSVPPPCLKKYATGRGTGPQASKEAVMAAAIRRYPDVDIDGNDKADGFVLAAIGADWLGHPIASVPEANRSVLTTISGWPDRLPGAPARAAKGR